MTYSITEKNKLDQKLPPAPSKWDRAYVDYATNEANLKYIYSGDEEWEPSNPDEEADFTRWKAARLSTARALSEAQDSLYDPS